MENGVGGYENHGADLAATRVDDVRIDVEVRKPSEALKPTEVARAYYAASMVLMIIVVVVLAIGLMTKGFGTWETGQAVCQTRGCAQAVARIVSYMDESVDPCEDFYSYVCGGLEKNNVIPRGASELSTMKNMKDNLDIHMKTVLERESPLDHLNVVKQAKILYRSCMNESYLLRIGSEPVIKFMNDNGGWALLQSNWNESTFDLEEYIVRMSEASGSIMRYQVQPNVFKNTERLIMIGAGSITYPLQMYLVPNPMMERYRDSLIRFALALGGENATLQVEVPKLIELETRLAGITPPWNPNSIPTSDQLTTLEEAEKLIPAINVTKLLNTALQPVNIALDNSSKIFLKDADYLKQVSSVIASTEKKTMASFIMYRAVRSLLKYTEGGLKSILEGGDDCGAQGSDAAITRPRYEECGTEVNRLLPFTLTRLYIDQYQQRETGPIDEMVRHLHDTFKTGLETQDWLDETSHREATRKAESMTFRISYPDFILNDFELEEETSVSDLRPDDYFSNIMEMKHGSTLDKLASLTKPKSRHTWEDPPPLLVNAFYGPSENVIVIPVGILQPPAFDVNGPMVMNYGAIGSVIGHEITHGFDSNARFYDHQGNIRPWLTDESLRHFHAKAKCVEDQYSNITIEQLGTNVNGKLTLSENIADLGGLKYAFRAYQEYVKEHGEETTLPGLNLTADQLYFVGFGQMNCRMISTPHLRMRARSQPHTPSVERVFGNIINSEDFAKAFNCASGVRMNPKEKCSFW